MLVQRCPDLKSHATPRGTELGSTFPSSPLENKESADGELFQICRGGHDFGGKVAKRLGIMICGEDSSTKHFDR